MSELTEILDVINQETTAVCDEVCDEMDIDYYMANGAWEEAPILSREVNRGRWLL